MLSHAPSGFIGKNIGITNQQLKLMMVNYPPF